MKKICLVLIVIIFLTLEISANENFSVSDFDTDSIIDSLPEEIRNELPSDDDLFSADTVEKSFTVEYIFDLILKTVKALLAPALKLLSTLLAMLIIASVLNNLKASFSSGAVGKVFDFTVMLLMLTVLLGKISELTLNVQSYLSRLQILTGSMLPVYTAVNLSSSAVTSAAAQSELSGLALFGISLFSTSVLFPTVKLCIGLGITNVLGNFRTEKLSKAVYGVLKWTLGLMSVIICAVMTFQNTIASKADSLALRTARFAVSSAIPSGSSIAGDATSTVAASLSLVRSSIGTAGIVLILLLTLPVLLETVLTRLCLLLSEAVAGIFGLNNEEKLLSEMNQAVGYLTVCCLISSIMFIYISSVFCNTVVG